MSIIDHSLPVSIVDYTDSKGIVHHVKKSPSLRNHRKYLMDLYLKEYDEKDLRFMYFVSEMAPNIVITAISNWKRDKGVAEVAFSFCSGRERFCMKEGKLQCFKHMSQPNHPFVVTVPWLDDGLLSTFLAFNRIAKPIKLTGARFNSLMSI